MPVVIATIAIIIILAPLLVALNAWPIMVIWGALASHFGFGTIGFDTAMLIALALMLVGGFFKGSSN